MGNASFNSVSHGISLKSSAGMMNAAESVGGSGAFKTPKGSTTSKIHAKPPMMSRSSQKFHPNSSNTQNQEQQQAAAEDQGPTEEELARQKEKKEKEKFDRLQQM